MNLTKFLRDNKKSIEKDWINVVIKSYHADISNFLKNKNDSFDNPVGSAIDKSLHLAFDELLQCFEKTKEKTDIKLNIQSDEIAKILDPIIRIRAVQDFTPSGAIEFVYSLKDIIRNKATDFLKKTIDKDKKIIFELLKLESLIDKFALIAFDVFMSCREKIYDLKVNDSKNQLYSACKKAGLIT